MTEPKLTEFESAWVTRLWADSARLGRLAEVKRDFESILAARLAPVETQLDEARANRDRLAHENAALRREMADLRAERDEYVRLRDEWARACASERRALAARGEDIARAIEAMAAQFVTMAEVIGLPFNEARRAKHAGYLEAADCARRAALDGPAPQPGEGYQPCICNLPPHGRLVVCPVHPIPPTTDAEEANDHG